MQCYLVIFDTVCDRASPPRDWSAGGQDIEQMTEWAQGLGEDVSDTGIVRSGDDMEHGDMGSDTDGNSGLMSQEDMDELGQPPLQYQAWSCAHESDPHSDRKGRPSIFTRS